MRKQKLSPENFCDSPGFLLGKFLCIFDAQNELGRCDANIGDFGFCSLEFGLESNEVNPTVHKQRMLRIILRSGLRAMETRLWNHAKMI